MIAHLDCWTGISGDKFLGALLDAGAPLDAVREAVDRLGLRDTELGVERVVRRGVSAAHLLVDEGEQRDLRRWPDIRSRVENAGLPSHIADRSLRVLARLAEAEAAVHGVPAEAVHFHELGAADTLVDVVGTIVALHALGVTRLVVSPVAVGSGTVETRHGTLPVPAPAAAELLRGLPVVAGPVAGELTTPTGAALVSTLADDYGPVPPMRVAAIGYGAGTRQLEVANVARVLIGAEETAESDSRWSIEDVVVLETNIDHISAERIGFAIDELMAAGAPDAWATPIVMKKSRPASLLSVLAPPAEADRLTSLVFELTGTLGVRRVPATRAVLPREIAEVDTRFGRVRVKLATTPSGRILARAEHDDCARIAREQRVAIEEVAAEAEAAARE